MSWSAEFKAVQEDPLIVSVRKRHKAFAPETLLCLNMKKRKTCQDWIPFQAHNVRSWLFSCVSSSMEKKTPKLRLLWDQSPVYALVKLQCAKYQENAFAVLNVLCSLLMLASKEELQLGLVRQDQGHMYVIQRWEEQLCFFNMKRQESTTMGDIRFQVPVKQADDMSALMLALFPVVIELCNHPEEWSIGLRISEPCLTEKWCALYSFTLPLNEWSQEVCNRLLRLKF